MEDLIVPGIIDAERLGDGVIISFEDGTSALYSTALIYAMLPQAERLPTDGL
jgi:hypothetical protein